MTVNQEANGFKGRISVQDENGAEVFVTSAANWSMVGESVNTVAIPNTFGQTRDENIFTTRAPNIISFDGVFPATSGQGYNILKDGLINEVEFGPEEIKFYTRDSDPQLYYTPNTGSHIRITLIDQVSVPAGGVTTFNGSCEVVGDLLRVYNPSV